MRHVYLHGFASGPVSTKASYFSRRFAEQGREIRVPDLAPDFERMTILTALDIALEAAGDGPAVLIGSSLGGYVAALAAERHPDRIAGLVLMAPAFDLVSRWRQWVPDEDIGRWEAEGTRQFQHHVLNRPAPLSFEFYRVARSLPVRPDPLCPALVFAGREDDVVPLAAIEPFVTEGTRRTLVVLEDDHGLSRDLPSMYQQVEEFLASLVPPG